VKKKRKQPKNQSAQVIRAFPPKIVTPTEADNKPLTTEEIQAQGYSTLVFDFKIPFNEPRPFSPQQDLNVWLDGWAIQGVGGFVLKGNPPYVEIQIVDDERFSQSVSRAGFLWQQGIYFTRILHKQGYPSIQCGTCDKGRLTLELGFLCNNPDCVHAAPQVIALKEKLTREAADAGFETIEEYLVDKLKKEADEKQAQAKIKKAMADIDSSRKIIPIGDLHDKKSAEVSESEPEPDSEDRDEDMNAKGQDIVNETKDGDRVEETTDPPVVTASE